MAAKTKIVMILPKTKSALVNKNPDIDPRKDIRAKVLTPPRVQSSGFLVLTDSLSRPITDPNKREIINLRNKGNPIKLAFNSWLTIFYNGLT
jgi:hypothetical protein